jgi:hypothetical protein
MAELVISTRSLPEPLFRMIRTEKVKVSETNGIVNLTPIIDSKSRCPLRGIAADSSLTVEKLYALTHDARELNQ